MYHAANSCNSHKKAWFLLPSKGLHESEEVTVYFFLDIGEIKGNPHTLETSNSIKLIYKFKTFKICLLEMIGSQLTKLFFKNISIFNYFLNTNNLLLLGIFKVLIFEQGRIWKRSS